MVYFGITDKGKIRKNNQDTYICENVRLTDSALLAVCDGMGGAKSGNIASGMTADIFRDVLIKNIDPFADVEAIVMQMKTAVEAANTEVYRKSVDDTTCRGMGTTIVAALVSKDAAVIANVGDSRAYIISRVDGVKQITRDHSVVEDMIQRGDITREQAKHHPNKNLITRAIGTSPFIRIDTFIVQLQEGDRILLCSDGLSNLVDDNVIARECLKSDDPQVCCEGLVNAALDLGAPDNVTAALVRI